jgi:hypothetical protein
VGRFNTQTQDWEEEEELIEAEEPEMADEEEEEEYVEMDGAMEDRSDRSSEWRPQSSQQASSSTSVPSSVYIWQDPSHPTPAIRIGSDTAVSQHSQLSPTASTRTMLSSHHESRTEYPLSPDTVASNDGDDDNVLPLLLEDNMPADQLSNTSRSWGQDTARQGSVRGSDRTGTPSLPPPPASIDLEEVYGVGELDDEDEDMEDGMDIDGEENWVAPEQPYADHFTTLTERTEDGPAAQAVAALVPQPVDVDRWELVITPDEYLERFNDSLATVHLVNRAPKRKLKTTFHRGPDFSHWLLLAEANHLLWIDPRFKDPFFEVLNRYQTAQPGRLEAQASLGVAHVSTSVFVHCLNEIGCDTLRMKEYGQKTPLEEQFLEGEPADVEHRWAEHNEWDIGKNFESDRIWLFASATGRTSGVQHFPMLVPGSKDFGSVKVKVQYNRRHYQVKVYPHLVHVIKSFNSRLQASVPKTLTGLRSQLTGALSMIGSLSTKDAMALGGFRIEVSVKSRTLQEAKDLVADSPLLEPNFWLGLGPGPHCRQLLTAKLVTRDGLLANANWVYGCAYGAGLFKGAGSDKPDKRTLQALTDVLNGLGWNSGVRPATKSLAQKAWWRDLDPIAGSDAFVRVSTSASTDQEIYDFFQRARNASHNGTIPCKAQPGNPTHRYQVHNRAPFRVRCSNGTCGSKLQRGALLHWLAELHGQGLLEI